MCMSLSIPTINTTTYKLVVVPFLSNRAVTTVKGDHGVLDTKQDTTSLLNNIFCLLPKHMVRNR